MRRRPLLVLGIGNVLMRDEGVGVHAIRRLLTVALPDHVHLLDGGTGGFHLLSCFQDYQRMILIDACLDGGEPGTVTLREPRFASEFPRSLTAHDIGLRDLIESAVLLGPLPHIHLVTVSVDPDQAMGTDLSPPVEDSLDRIVDTVARILATEPAPSA